MLLVDPLLCVKLWSSRRLFSCRHRRASVVAGADTRRQISPRETSRLQAAVWRVVATQLRSGAFDTYTYLLNFATHTDKSCMSHREWLVQLWYGMYIAGHWHSSCYQTNSIKTPKKTIVIFASCEICRLLLCRLLQTIESVHCIIESCIACLCFSSICRNRCHRSIARFAAVSCYITTCCVSLVTLASS